MCDSNKILIIRLFVTLSFTVIAMYSLISCDEFLKVDLDKSQITKERVFEGDVTATSAVIGIYSDMYTVLSSFASGSQSSITGLCGMSSGQLHYSPDNPEFQSFELYNIKSDNYNIASLWKSMYYTIYSANNALEGLEESSALSKEIKAQLMGEVLFIRAFSYFYLVNLFGPIPLVTSTDYRNNSALSRLDDALVYEQIISDLTRSKSLLSDEYVTGGRIRPNRSSATALLARVYLYLKEWDKAELNASEVIGNEKYVLLSDISLVFLKDSEEAIWQLMPTVQSSNTNEANVFLLYVPPQLNTSSPFELTSDLLDVFESGDLRRSRWIDSLVSEDAVFYYPAKYKVKDGDLQEYSVVIRLAEMYLIRSESRIMQDKLVEAISDINRIRERSGLPLISGDSGVTASGLLLLVERERETELFSEWGHRWFDLKRTGRAKEILGGRSGYSVLAELYPIPKQEFNKNPHLGDQNDGY